MKNSYEDRGELIRLYARIAWLYLKRQVIPFTRSQDFVEKEYEILWERADRNEGRFADKRRKLGFLDGKLIAAPESLLMEVSYESLVKWINHFQPESVLELGCGNGRNIVELAARCPSVKRWEGIELTSSGVVSATKKGVTALQGDMRNLPYADNSFDVVFTLNAIEQIPHGYREAFDEAYRVTKRGQVFVECFKEAQCNVFQRMHKANVDYFDGSITEAKGDRIFFSPNRFVKATYADGTLVCEKRN